MKNQNKNGIAKVMAIKNKLPAGLISVFWLIDTIGNIGGVADWAMQAIKLVA